MTAFMVPVTRLNFKDSANVIVIVSGQKSGKKQRVAGLAVHGG